MVGEKTIQKETRRLTELNKIDGVIGAQNVGAILDLYNEGVDKKRERHYSEEITSRNKYFLPLWRRVVDEMDMGHKSIKQEKKKIQIPIEATNKIYLGNGEEIVVK